MSLDIKIPAVGESITSGLISVWHKADGDPVNAGDALLTLETDKVSTELTAERAGVLRIKVPADTEVKIGEVVGSIEEGGAAAVKKEANVAPKAVETASAAPEGQVVAPAHTLTAKPVQVEDERTNAGEQPAAAPSEPTGSALGKAIATANEVLGVPNEEEAAPVAKEGRSTRKRMSPLRRKIAAQLVMAQQTAAILTTFNECDMSAVMKFRSEMQEAFVKQYGLKLGFMSFFVKAAVSALKSVPSINSRVDGDDIVQNHYYDVGVAVGTERGLVVPVIRDADQKSFADIEKDIVVYAGKARDGKIKIEDLQGGVFTISNGGIYGSLLSTPILNPPQSGILGMHKILERPIAVGGQVVIRPMMNLALSYDHRVVDGKEAVTFLIRVKDCIENPGRLMLDL